MRRKTHNGFVLEYNGKLFPISKSNEITYDCFCLMGGLSNDRLYKVQKLDSTYSYYRRDIP